MAERPAVQTRSAPDRRELASFCKSPQQIKFFEGLGDDVGNVLPNATMAAMQAAEAAQAAAAAAQAAADAAAQAAAAAQTAADAALALARDLAMAPTALQLSDLQALRRRIAALEQGTSA